MCLVYPDGIHGINRPYVKRPNVWIWRSRYFGGPGWIIGGEFVPDEDRSKDLVPTFTDLTGPQTLTVSFPVGWIKTKR